MKTCMYKPTILAYDFAFYVITFQFSLTVHLQAHVQVRLL